METATLDAATRPLSKLPPLLGHTDAVLGPFYVFMHFWLQVSHSLWWMRLPGAVASASTAAVLVVLGRRWSTSIGLVAGFIFAIAPMTSRYAEYARPYSFATLAATLATWRLLVAVERRTRRAWLFYAGAVIIVGLAHLFALLLLPAHAWYARRQMRTWAISTASAIVLLSPLLFYGTTEVDSELSWVLEPGVHSFRAFIGELSGSAALTVVLGALLIIGTARFWRADRDAAALLLCWLVFPPVALLTVSQWHPVFVNRYLAFTLPALCLLVAVALASLRASVTFAAIALIVGLAVPSQLQLRGHAAHDGMNLASLASQLDHRVRPTDGVLYEPSWIRRIFTGYAKPPAGPDVMLATSPLASNTLDGRDVDAAVVVQRIRPLHRVWVVQLIDRASKQTIYRDANAVLRTRQPTERIAIPGGSITLRVSR